MDVSLSSAFALGELRLALLRELGHSLAQAQAALLASEIDRFASFASRQREICAQLCSLQTSSSPQPEPADRNLHNLLAAPKQESVPRSAPEWGRLSRDLLQARTEIQDRTRLYAALLRRMRKTVEIFCRVLACSDVTYTAPQPVASPTSV